MKIVRSCGCIFIEPLLMCVYVCVYSAQCGVRVLLVCVQCTVQSETFIGVCTVHSVE